MSRLGPIGPDGLDDDQQAIWDAVTSGPRASGGPASRLVGDDGGLVGPFNALLAAPRVGRRVSELGEAVRFGTDLDPVLREVAILVSGRHHRARFEWWAHARIAASVGVADDVIDAIGRGERPDGDAALLLVHDAAVELLSTHALSEDTYRGLVDTLGEAQTAELALVLGYYGLISTVLNVFDVAAPDPVPFD